MATKERCGKCAYCEKTVEKPEITNIIDNAMVSRFR
jgi:aspartate carbamoyltransferase regulatory subunit